MQSDELKRRISAGRGDALADLVLKNARIVNVFTDEIDTADIAISGNSIVGVGTYHGRKEVDLHGKYVCPGLIDGHIHIESSMLCGPAFEQAVLPHGTTAVVTDPHEISNVAGLEGLDFMLETTKNLTLSVYFMLPSCVPATDLDESGAVLNAEQLRPYYGDPRVLGLAELMNAYGTVRCDPKILQKIRDCTEAGKIVDGHAPLLSAKDLNAYIAAGVQSDHECSNIEEAMEKLQRGQYIMIREGTAAKNMEALMPLFREPYCSRCMLVTDDKHPGDLLDSGHIDSNIRKAIRLGADPAVAVKMASLVPAQYFGLKQHGAVAPGYRADLVVVSDLESFTVEQVYKNGTLVAEHGKTLKPAPLDIDRVRFSHVMDSFDLDEITLQDLELRESGEQERVICLNRGELLTEEKIIPFQRHPGKAPGVDPEHNIVKLAVFERHHHSGHVGINELHKAAILHFAFAYYHPYFDGNGRTARLFHLWYLVQQGYPAALFTPFSRYIAENKDAYYKAYERVERNALIPGYTDVTPFLFYFCNEVYNRLQVDAVPPKTDLEVYQTALAEGKITEKERLLWEYVLSAYGAEEFTTKQLEKDFRNAAYATIRTFVMKFHEMGLLTARKAGNRVFYRVGGTSDGRPL